MTLVRRVSSSVRDEETILTFPTGLSKAEIATRFVNKLPAAVFPGQICVTDSLEEANAACRAAGWVDCGIDGSSTSSPLLGFDTEAAVVWGKGAGRGAQPTTLLQLASERHAVLLSIAGEGKAGLFADPDVPNVFRDILQSHAVAKIAQGAAQEMKPLKAELGIEANAVVDLIPLSEAAGLKPLALRYVAAQVLRLRLSKRHQTSNWSRYPLKQPQIAYAAADAWAPMAVYKRLIALTPKLGHQVEDQLAGLYRPGIKRYVHHSTTPPPI